MVLYDLHTSALHKTGVEFHQEFIRHGLSQMKHVLHVSDTFFSFRYYSIKFEATDKSNSCNKKPQPKTLTLVLDELHPSVLHVNWSEFCQEFNGDGPRHVTRVYHMSDTFFFILVQFSVTFDQAKLHSSVLHVNWSEFCQEFNGDSPRHVTCVCHMSDT